MNSYIGKMLFVDLSTGKTEVRELTEELVRAFPGGNALGARILYEEMPANTPVFAPESMVGFVCGALNSTGGFMTNRYMVVSKSPVTGGWNDANSGGSFGPALRGAGYDALFVKGKAEKPVYIFIDNGAVEVRSAEQYWGMKITDFEKAVKEELGKKVCCATIGVAGEQMHGTAAVMNDGHRAAGRGGTGAVMGSKNLKSVVVCGNQKVTVADKARMIEINKEIIDWQHNGPVKDVHFAFDNWGTGASYEGSIYSGDVGMKNWAGSDKDCSDAVKTAPSAQEMDKRFKKKKYACLGCPVGCGAVYDLTREGGESDDAGRPEYETTGAFGAQLLNGDSFAINTCNNWCNEYGLDTISVGGTIAWAMECYDKGILTKEELDGIDLSWGNAEAIVALCGKICRSEGVGAILAEGSRAAAKHFGKGEECLVVAGGIEFPMHDARLAPPLARTYKFDPTPGRHVKGGVGPTSGGRPDEFKNNPEAFLAEDVAGTAGNEMLQAGGFCVFTDWGYRPGAMLDYFNAATGFDFTPEEFHTAGMRSFMMRHAFNLREGFRREDTTISDRMVGKPPLTEGPLAGVTMDVEKMGDNFYAAIGCDAHGVPAKATLEALGGMEAVIRDLYPEA